MSLAGESSWRPLVLLQKPNRAGRGKGHLLQSDLCSARPNDKTFKVKEWTMAWEKVHSKDNKPQSKNLKLSLALKDLEVLQDEISFFHLVKKKWVGSRMEGAQPGGLEDLKLRVTYCLPCHTQRLKFPVPVVLLASFRGTECDSSYYPWLRFSFPIVLPLCLTFDGSLQSLLWG